MEDLQPAVRAALTTAYKRGSTSRVIRAADLISLPGMKKAPKKRMAATLELVDGGGFPAENGDVLLENEEETASDAEDIAWRTILKSSQCMNCSSSFLSPCDQKIVSTSPTDAATTGEQKESRCSWTREGRCEFEFKKVWLVSREALNLLTRLGEALGGGGVLERGRDEMLAR